MNQANYKCPKCGSTQYETGEMRATGSFWTKLFNVQNLTFITITCNACGYTELYKKTGDRTLENILDFFSN